MRKQFSVLSSQLWFRSFCKVGTENGELVYGVWKILAAPCSIFRRALAPLTSTSAKRHKFLDFQFLMHLDDAIEK